MGLFSFLKNTGSKLFTGKTATERAEEAAAAARAEAHAEMMSNLKTEIQRLQLPIDNMEVQIDDDKITVYGQTDTQEDREKVILAMGNVDGIATVDDRISVTNPAPEAVFYEVKGGDSLSKIAQAVYGDPMAYQRIFEANMPMLSHPDKIYPGQVLRIPQG